MLHALLHTSLNPQSLALGPNNLVHPCRGRGSGSNPYSGGSSKLGSAQSLIGACTRGSLANPSPTHNTASLPDIARMMDLGDDAGSRGSPTASPHDTQGLAVAGGGGHLAPATASTQLLPSSSPPKVGGNPTTCAGTRRSYWGGSLSLWPRGGSMWLWT